MRKAMMVIAGLALAAPAAAQAPIFDNADREMVDALPSAAEVEAVAPLLDQVMGSILRVDVGPLLDAADPYRRRVDHGDPGRTLGELAHRDDPWFEDRMRSSIHGVTSDMGRMMEAIAAAAPVMRRSLREFEHGIGVALDDYERSRDERGRDWPEEGY
jgi:hypothetical protein